MNRGKRSLLFAGIFTFVCLSPLAGQVSVKIAATVNGAAITQTDVDEILSPIYQQYQSTYQGEVLEQKLATARADILNQLIEDKLLLQEAQKQKETLLVDEKEIDRLVADLKAKFKTDEEFRAVLNQQKFTLLDLRKRYHEQLLVKHLVEKEVISHILITPAQIADYYAAHQETFREPDEARLRNIFIASRGDDEILQTKIREIYAKAHKGVPFAELVERYSEDQNVVAAGDMGTVKKGTMRPEIDSVVFVTPAGEVAPLVKTPNGYYIFKVEERRDSYIPALDKLQSVIRRRLFDDEMRVRMDEWVAKLRNQAYIEVNENEAKEKS